LSVDIEMENARPDRFREHGLSLDATKHDGKILSSKKL